METKGFGPHQTAVSPGQGFLQYPAIAGSAELGGSPRRGSQAAIQTDGQHQTENGPGGPLDRALKRPPRSGIQTAARASSAAGAVCSWGVSANTSAALLGLS